MTGVPGCTCVFKEEYDVYPSVLASINTAASAGTADGGALSGDTSFYLSQYFATGQAARELAANDEVSKAFKTQAAESLGVKGVYIKDDAGEILKKFWKPDGTKNEENEKELKAWIDKNISSDTSGPSITFFLRGKQYSKDREKAVKNLGLPRAAGSETKEAGSETKETGSETKETGSETKE